MSTLSEIIVSNYIRLVNSLQGAGTDGASQFANILAQQGMTPSDFYTYVATEQARDLGLYRFINADESVRFYGFQNPQGLLASSPVDDAASAINSNLGTATNAATNTFTSVISGSTALNALDLMLTYGTVNRYTPETPLQNVLAFSTKVSPAMQMASVGARLGKAIDGALYDMLDALNLNPPWSLNPETWSTITSNEDGPISEAFNWLLAINSEGKVQCYTDDESFAYCAQWLNERGFFSSTAGATTTDPNLIVSGITYPLPIASSLVMYDQSSMTSGYMNEYSIADGNFLIVGQKSGNAYYNVSLQASSPSENASYTMKRYSLPDMTLIQEKQYKVNTRGLNYNGKVNYYSSVSEGRVYNCSIEPYTSTYPDTSSLRKVMYVAAFGDMLGPVEGVSDNGGAVPDVSTWKNSDISAIRDDLYNQYPDLGNDVLQVDTVQPDGSTKRYTYVPVAPATDVTAIGNPDTQALPATDFEIDPNTATATQLQTLIEALTQSMFNPQTLTNPELNPEAKAPDGSNQDNQYQKDKNPGDTGHGLVPPVVLPTGDASSLWAVYHPTQSQLNAFGAWLWSSDFVEQIKRLFNDPMQAVIGVHKVFAPIPTGGSSTIKCGYLDSGVSSATVSSQYTEIDCGTVDCREYFGNVFDYDPHTKVSIYLPFIGVVPLKVSEVMRSTINVTYGVDVITGACLAKVKVTRDGGGGILYSYGGSCACHYPISSGSYAGIISGIVTSAIGIAGGIATGNPIAAIGGAMAGLHQAHTDVQRSGGFTGCAGAMGPKKPYLIIDRPQTKLAFDFETYQGKPANSTQFIGDCAGFVRATEVHFSAPGAFDDEAKEVEALLKSGVILD